MGFRLSALRILSIMLLLAVPLAAAAQTTVRPDRVGLSQERLAGITAYAAILMAQTYFPSSREDFEFAVMQAVID